MNEGQEKGELSPVEARLTELEEELKRLKAQLEPGKDENSVSIICFSGEWDRLFAALTIAAGSLAMGREVHLFFTFWAVSALRAEGKLDKKDKSFLQSMFNRMLPCGPRKAPLSKFNCWGLGKVMMKKIMKEKGVDDIDTLFDEVKELGAHIHICDTSTTLFGLNCEELDAGENPDQCGVATFLSHAFKSTMVLFI